MWDFSIYTVYKLILRKLLRDIGVIGSWNNGMVWAGRDLKDHLVPIPPLP